VGLLLTALLLYLIVSWLEGIQPLFQGGATGGWPKVVDRETAFETVGSSVEVTAGLLSIVITVVAIVLELAATRYTHRISELFVRDPINVIVLSFFVLTTVLSLWISATFTSGPAVADAWLPNATLWLPVGMLSVCLIILLPYFAFVFAFVSPLNTIRHLRKQATQTIHASANPRRNLDKTRHRILESIEELSDLARGALAQKDRSIAMEVADSFGQLLRTFWAVRDELPEPFFTLDGPVAQDPDFVSTDASVRRRISDQGSWLEVKIFQQLLEIFSNSVGTARDVGNFLAITMRDLAIDTKPDSRQTLSLCLQVFNSCLRATINGRDLRLAYYVLDLYRQVAEDLVERGDEENVIQIGQFMRYYGQISYDAGLGFLLETVAYDLSRLIDRAQELNSPATDPLLVIFLEVERPEEPTHDGEDRLLAVRRIQAQLAAALLSRGDTKHANQIRLDMQSERPERLRIIQRELMEEERAEYWEFSDRGVNFAYLPPEQRPFLEAFFASFTPPLSGGGVDTAP